MKKRIKKTCSNCVYGTFFKDISRIGSGFCIYPNNFGDSCTDHWRTCDKWKIFDKEKNKELLEL